MEGSLRSTMERSTSDHMPVPSPPEIKDIKFTTEPLSGLLQTVVVSALQEVFGGCTNCNSTESTASLQTANGSVAVTYNVTVAELRSSIEGEYIGSSKSGSLKTPRPEVVHATPVAEPPAIAFKRMSNKPHEIVSLVKTTDGAP